MDDSQYLELQPILKIVLLGTKTFHPDRKLFPDAYVWESSWHLLKGTEKTNDQIFKAFGPEGQLGNEVPRGHVCSTIVGNI